MKLPIPGPRDVLRLGEQGRAAVQQALELVPRLAAIVTTVEAIVVRVVEVVEAVDATRARADLVVAQTELVVGRAEALTARATPLLDAYEQPLTDLHPVLRTLARTTTPEEVEALVGLVDLLPQIVTQLDEQVLPVMGTLGTVAPDLRDLLDISRELNELIGSLPGLGRVKRRIEEEQAEEDAERSEADRSQS